MSPVTGMTSGVGVAVGSEVGVAAGTVAVAVAGGVDVAVAVGTGEWQLAMASRLAPPAAFGLELVWPGPAHRRRYGVGVAVGSVGSSSPPPDPSPDTGVLVATGFTVSAVAVDRRHRCQAGSSRPSGQRLVSQRRRPTGRELASASASGSGTVGVGLLRSATVGLVPNDEFERLSEAVAPFVAGIGRDRDCCSRLRRQGLVAANDERVAVPRPSSAIL